VVNTWEKLVCLILDLREIARRGDWYQIGRWFIETLISLPYRRIEYTVFVRSLLEPLPVVEPRLPVTLGRATEADLVRFRDLVPPSGLRYFARRLARGRYCFLALEGENLAAYCWATTQVDPGVDNLEIQLQPGDCYGDDAYTFPAYRRQGIQTALLLYRLVYMKNLGYQRLIAIVEDDNVASQRMVRKLGYRVMDHLSFRRILWKRTYRYREGKF
jgi:ribosomal protein S18 acetylase RimI-like enzyme